MACHQMIPFRFVENNIPFKSIATSTAQNDSGVFELNFRDERYLPFEGARVISSWKLELNGKYANPKDSSKTLNLAQFDYDSVSDIIIHIKYTARVDVGTFKNSAIAHLEEYISPKVINGNEPFTRFQNMIDAGAKGYVLKNIEPAEMLTAIKTIFSDKRYYCNDVAIKFLEAEEEKTIVKIRSKKNLTPRETGVLQMIARQMTNDEIAQKLYVAKRTVDPHRQNLIKKLDVKNTVGLVRAAYKLKLVEE